MRKKKQTEVGKKGGDVHALVRKRGGGDWGNKEMANVKGLEGGLIYA